MKGVNTDIKYAKHTIHYQYNICIYDDVMCDL